jgi:hypothetical protein
LRGRGVESGDGEDRGDAGVFERHGGGV